MCYVGFDVGTSSLKVIVMDERQMIQKSFTYAYTYEEPFPGYREIDPKVWINAIQQAWKDISTLQMDIRYIGVSGQMHTTIVLDALGNVIRPAIMWNDTRTAQLLDKVRKDDEIAAKFPYLHKMLSTGSPYINLLWLKLHEPNHFGKIRHVMSSYAYVVHYVTGIYSNDYCAASTSGVFDIYEKQYVTQLLDQLGMKESVFGIPCASNQVVGTLSSEICRHLHVSHPIYVIAGTGDNPAQAIALGALQNKQPLLSLGTSGVVMLPKNGTDFVKKGKNVLIQVDQKMLNIVQGVVQSAGGAHAWWVKQIHKEIDMTMDQDLISIQALGKNEILFYPHIAGDKTLHNDPGIRGMFLGLSTMSKRQDMTQAVLEGVGYGFLEVLEHMTLPSWPQSILVSGGGSKSTCWMQILAHIVGSRVEVVDTQASPAYGVCLLAMMTDGKHSAVQHVITQSYEPDARLHEAYMSQYQKYKKLYALIKAL